VLVPLPRSPSSQTIEGDQTRMMRSSSSLRRWSRSCLEHRQGRLLLPSVTCTSTSSTSLPVAFLPRRLRHRIRGELRLPFSVVRPALQPLPLHA
jgi:hypothetical protein